MDIVRMIAALVVMMGHLLHTKGSKSGFLIGSHVEKIFSSGSFAVIVFFGLSGMALRFQTDKYGINSRWFIARIIRLMPVYLITFIPPVIGCYLIGVQISYPSYGFIIAAVGLQAIASNLTIPPVNGPLWSLSVEIYLSASLLIFGRWKKVSGFFILVILTSLNFIIPENEILRGMPIFFLGFLMPGFQEKLRKIGVMKLAMIQVPIFVILVVPSSLQGRFQPNFNFIYVTVLATLIIAWTLLSNNSARSMWTDLSQRSYSLYAVHAPVILLIDKTVFSSDKVISLIQVGISLVFVFLATEIIYRFVEKPSIHYSRKFLTKYLS